MIADEKAIRNKYHCFRSIVLFLARISKYVKQIEFTNYSGHFGIQHDGIQFAGKKVSFLAENIGKSQF